MNNNRTILHVDDDPSVLRLVSERLGKEGYDVISLENPMQALAKRIESNARIVLLDIDMPQINGLTLLKELKNQDGGVHVIMLTGVVTMDTVLRSMRWGAEECLFKPLTDFEKLLETLEVTYCKIDRWWKTLHDLNQMTKNTTSSLSSCIADQEQGVLATRHTKNLAADNHANNGKPCHEQQCLDGAEIG